MATRQSTLIRSKRAETRVAKFLFGPDARRDWKDDHDLSGEDADGNRWIGEVKNHAWPAGPKTLWDLLEKALLQAEKHSNRAFAVYIPKSASIEDGLVMIRMNDSLVIKTLREFQVHLGLHQTCYEPATETDNKLTPNRHQQAEGF